MATNTTQWSPDTCTCVITYTWDSAIDSLLRIHTPVVHMLCPHHAILGTDTGYLQVIAENTCKNNLLAKAANLLGTNFDINTITWDYSADRILNIHIPKIVANIAPQLQDFSNTTFGTGKVNIS